jgi:hypothetical protein
MIKQANELGFIQIVTTAKFSCYLYFENIEIFLRNSKI